MSTPILGDDRLAAISVLAAQPHETRQRMIKDAREGNPHRWTPALVQLLRAIGTVCRTPDDWRQLRRELTERRQARKPQNALLKSRTSTRPRARRQPGRRSPKTSRGPDDGDGPSDDDDPVERRIAELVDAAPPLSPGQQRRLAQLLGGAR